MNNPNKILKSLMAIGVRVVPDLLPGSRTYEIIVEPWDYNLNVRGKGRTKRTGVFFQQKDLNKKINNIYYPKLQEIQMKIIKKNEIRIESQI